MSDQNQPKHFYYSLAWFSGEVTVGGKTVDRSQAGPKGFFAFTAQIEASVISPKGSHTHTMYTHTHTHSLTLVAKENYLNWTELNWILISQELLISSEQFLLVYYLHHTCSLTLLCSVTLLCDSAVLCCAVCQFLQKARKALDSAWWSWYLNGVEPIPDTVIDSEEVTDLPYRSASAASIQWLLCVFQSSWPSRVDTFLFYVPGWMWRA